MKTIDEFEDLLARASKAGFEALAAATPTPMVVSQHASPMDDNSPVTKQWYVSEGACGFAWVVLRPATTKFARYLKKTRMETEPWARNRSQVDSEGGFWGKHYGGGYDFWVAAGNQSIARKEAFARAYAEVLREAGFTAHADSRMD